jgi:hypothetical protein
MREVVDDVNGHAPGDPVNLEVDTVSVTRPRSLYQGDLHRRHSSITCIIWQADSGRPGLRCVPVPALSAREEPPI